MCLCRVTCVYELSFWRYFTLKVPKIYPAGLRCFASWPTRRVYQRRQCTAAATGSGIRGRRRIRGLTVDTILLQASAYIAVIAGTTATFLVITM